MELETNGKAKYLVPVSVYDQETLVAKFDGTFVVLR
jgi:acyl-coenzyme A thioesterase PaaI-like protein